MEVICMHYSEERKDCMIGKFPPCFKCPNFIQRASNKTEEKLNEIANLIQTTYKAFVRWNVDYCGYALTVNLPYCFVVNIAIDEMELWNNWKKYKRKILDRIKNEFVENILLK